MLTIRQRVERIFRHPVSHNIEWHDVLSLLEGVARLPGDTTAASP